VTFDGYAERTAILNELKQLAGGRVEQGLPDDLQLQKYTENGLIKPYINVQFGRPIPTTGDRGMGVGERKQPYLMAFTVECYAADADTAGRTAAAVTNLLIDFVPNGPNSGGVKGAGGFNYTKPIQQSKPTRFAEDCFFTVLLNLSTD
jgi:hypothetical protein